MEEKITNRLQELVQQINNLLEEQVVLDKRAKRVRDSILSKQGAIFELKGLLEPTDE